LAPSVLETRKFVAKGSNAAPNAERLCLLFSLLLLLTGCISTGGGRLPMPPGTVEDLGIPVKELRMQLGPLSPDPAGTGFVQLLDSLVARRSNDTRVVPAW